MFFVPTVHDAPLKDDVNLMDIAPFSLSKTVRHGVIRYELKDAIITIEGGAESAWSPPTTTTSSSTWCRTWPWPCATTALPKKGLRPSLPPRTYRPSAAEILKFCRREQGGRQYEQLEPRSIACRPPATRSPTLPPAAPAGTAESFPLIGRYKVVSRTRQDKIDQIEIDIPDWVYSGVVSPRETPSILTLNSDYFLIARPIAKFIYRLARKATGAAALPSTALTPFTTVPARPCHSASSARALRVVTPPSPIPCLTSTLRSFRANRVRSSGWSIGGRTRLRNSSLDDWPKRRTSFRPGNRTSFRLRGRSWLFRLANSPYIIPSRAFRISLRPVWTKILRPVALRYTMSVMTTLGQSRSSFRSSPVLHSGLLAKISQRGYPQGLR